MGLPSFEATTMDRLVIIDKANNKTGSIIVLPHSFSITVGKDDLDLIPVEFQHDGKRLYDIVLGTDGHLYDKYKSETFDAIKSKVADFVTCMIAEDISLFMNHDYLPANALGGMFQAKAMDIDKFYDRWTQKLEEKIDRLAKKAEEKQK